jgi:hypothetical protein
MELAIPLIAMGCVYLVSNQKKREGYRQRTQTTDQYFQPPAVSAKDAIVDLAGRAVDRNFVSETMVPYFGKQKRIGPELRQQAEQTMDAYTGAGSLQTSKTEVAPLFSPEENVQWANGAPNQTDFYRSRVNPALKNSNVKPFEEQRVGPGLNQGFSSSGSGGFNSGLEARSTWLDKNVDELRVESKPKVSFELTNHQGPAQTLVKNLGVQPPVEKQLPDRYFANSPARYLTTVGAEQRPTQRSLQPDPTIHRATTSKPYVGGAGNGGVEHQSSAPLVRLDNRQQLPGPSFLPASGPIGNNLTTETATYTAYSNNRNSKPLPRGGAGGLISAITAPFTDILRPARREINMTAQRLGGAGATVSSAPALPTDRPLATTRETTQFSPFDRGQRPFLPTDGFFQAPQQGTTTQRDTAFTYMGASGSMLPKQVSSAAESNATISSARGQVGRTAGGNISTFHAQINQVTAERKHVAYTGGASATYPTPPKVHREETRAAQTYELLDRNNPDLLSAFKENPYTKSLYSVA